MISISISKIIGRQILDSRGNPTVEADVYLSNGAMGRAAVPSGASTGTYEAVELRDGGEWFGGKAVTKAVDNINNQIADRLKGFNAFDQRELDRILKELDGTSNKANLGANAILAVSLATAKAAANASFKPLYQYVAEITHSEERMSLPLPMMNVMNGGQHAAGSTDIQEFMIIPTGARTFQHGLEIGANVFHTLAKILRENNYMTTVGDEGGYAPSVTKGNSEPLEYIIQAIERAGYTPGKDVNLALDVAATEFFRDGLYHLDSEDRHINANDMIAWLSELSQRYPIISIEDGLAEDDWLNWHILNEHLGDKVQIVGDDLLVTNRTLLDRGINERSANSILIKPNQIGTLTETMDAVRRAQAAGWTTVMSHRSGETEDTTIAHLAVGLGTGQLKTGSLSRTDRVAKYNEILRISESNRDLKLANPFRLQQ